MEGVDLGAFLPRRSYALSALKQHFTITSPVFRYAIRLAAAMMAGQAIAPGFINMLAHPESSLFGDGRALDEIFPGPGGRAPEAYAW